MPLLHVPRPAARLRRELQLVRLGRRGRGRLARQHGRHFQREVVVAGELERHVFARQLVAVVGRRAAAPAARAARRRGVGALARRRRGRRRGRRACAAARGGHRRQFRLGGGQRGARRGGSGRLQLVGHRLAHRGHCLLLVLLLQILPETKTRPIINTFYTAITMYICSKTVLDNNCVVSLFFNVNLSRQKYF